MALQEDAVSPKWQEARSKYWWRKTAAPLPTNSGDTHRPARYAPMPARYAPTAKAALTRDAYKRRLAGVCYRCLASDHRVAQCRDPVRCLRCRGNGHISSSCPSRQPRSISTKLRSRLQFPPESIHSRISFPPLPSSSPVTQDKPPLQGPAASPAMEHVPGFPSRRTALGHSAIVATEAMAREAGRLLAHAVEVDMPEDGYRPTTLEVSYALSGQLRVPRFDIRVSRRDSDTFLAEFKMAPGRDRLWVEDTSTSAAPAFPSGRGARRGGPWKLVVVPRQGDAGEGTNGGVE